MKNFEQILALADAGDVDAILQVGFAHETGDGVAKDSREAVRWYSKCLTEGGQHAINMMWPAQPEATA